EYGRWRGTGGGYASLEALPGWLGEPSPLGKGGRGQPWPNLFALFQPQQRTRPLFSLLVAVLETQGAGGARTVTAILTTMLRLAPWAAVLGALPGLFLVATLLMGGQVAGWGWAVAVGLALAAAGTLAGAVGL